MLTFLLCDGSLECNLSHIDLSYIWMQIYFFIPLRCKGIFSFVIKSTDTILHKDSLYLLFTQNGKMQTTHWKSTRAADLFSFRHQLEPLSLLDSMSKRTLVFTFPSSLLSGNGGWLFKATDSKVFVLLVANCHINRPLAIHGSQME